MTEGNEHYLGIDWGSAKVGLSLAHSETGLALPYATLPNNKDLIRKIGEIIVREEVGTVVIGIPSYVNREEVEYPGEAFGRLLAGHFPVRIAYQNEMFTTKLAREHLIAVGARRISEHDDEEAAKIILQEWLDNLKKDT